MMRPMSSVFLEHQLLHCQTIEQCMMLNADVRKGEGVDQMRTGVGVGKGVFLADVLYGRPLVIRHKTSVVLAQILFYL